MNKLKVNNILLCFWKRGALLSRETQFHNICGEGFLIRLCLITLSHTHTHSLSHALTWIRLLSLLGLLLRVVFGALHPLTLSLSLGITSPCSFPHEGTLNPSIVPKHTNTTPTSLSLFPLFTPTTKDLTQKCSFVPSTSVPTPSSPPYPYSHSFPISHALPISSFFLILHQKHKWSSEGTSSASPTETKMEILTLTLSPGIHGKQPLPIIIITTPLPGWSTLSTFQSLGSPRRRAPPPIAPRPRGWPALSCSSLRTAAFCDTASSSSSSSIRTVGMGPTCTPTRTWCAWSLGRGITLRTLVEVEPCLLLLLLLLSAGGWCWGISVGKEGIPAAGRRWRVLGWRRRRCLGVRWKGARWRWWTPRTTTGGTRCVRCTPRLPKLWS